MPTTPLDAVTTSSNTSLSETASAPATQAMTDTVSGTMVDSAADVANAITTTMPINSTFTWGGYFQAIGVLLLLLAVLCFAVWAMRKYGRFNFLPKPGAFPRDGMHLEAQLPLGPRKSLMVVRFLDKRLLLGVTDHQITLLKETGDNDEKDVVDFKDIMESVQSQKSDV